MTRGVHMADPVRVMQDTDTVLEFQHRPMRRAAISVGAILVAVATGLGAITDDAGGAGIIGVLVTALIGGMILREPLIRYRGI